MTAASINLGGLDLNSDVFTDGWRIRTLADGFEPGTPAAVKSVVEALLLDGEDERITRVGNKPFPFRVRIEGEDLAATRRGGLELSRVCAQQRVELKVRLDGLTEMSVFDTVNIDPAAEQFDDLAQVLRAEQVWSLALTCLPWARPETPSTVTFTNAGATNGLLTVPVGGSQRTHAKVTVRKTAGGAIAFTALYVYSDPTMATHGWIPNDPTTWANCPAGPENSYTLWAQGISASPGVWREVTITNASAYYGAVEVLGSRGPLAGMGGPPANFDAMGVANLGGVYDPVLGQVAGPMTFAATVNSSPVSLDTTLPIAPGYASLMLTRNHPDAAFTNVLITGSADSLILMPPRLGRFDAVYDGVVFKTGTTLIDATDRAVHHAPVVLTPDVNGQSVVWVSSDPKVVNSLTGYTVEFEFYEQHNGWVA